jgi:hypothetical protein
MTTQSLSQYIEKHLADDVDINSLVPDTYPKMPVWLQLLMYAEECYSQDEHEVKKQKLMDLLEKTIKPRGKPAYKRYRNQRTAFSIALYNSYTPVTALILVNDGLDLSLETKYPPVMDVVYNFPIWIDENETCTDELALLKAVLETGQSPNIGYDGKLPLHYACGLSQVPAVELLLKYGADVNLPDNIGATPIMHAIDEPRSFSEDVWTREKPVEMVELLLKHGATVDARTKQNRTFHSIVKNACNAETKRKIFELVELYLGKDALTPPKAPPKKQFQQLLTDEQIAGKDELLYWDKGSQIEWMLDCFHENGVSEFETGHIAKAYQALQLPTEEGFNDIRKCSNSEAKKYLKKIMRIRKGFIEENDEIYKFI